MDLQQPHGYMRPPPPPPPPPPSSDLYYHHHQRPPPPSNPWYTNQFPQQLQPPPPPSQQHHQWPPQQHSDQYLPPHHSYPSNPPLPPPPSYLAPPNHYPHPPPHSHASLPPRPPHMPPHVSHSFPQVNQEWGPTTWGHQQSWDYQANNNEEAWAAKARAWAASKVASDDQQSQHTAYAFNNGSTGADFTSAPSVHQQEVPSTYTSVAGDSIRGMDHAAAAPHDYSFVPSAEPAVVYPPVSAMFPAGSQVDYAVTAPSAVPGHPAPIYGRMPGPSFQPTVSSVTPYGMGLAPELHPVTTFPGDSFGVSVTAERPKKASVPNWLREEIIKNKPLVINSAAELPKDDFESTEDDSGKGDKSFDSRSTEEDDDEEDLEAAKTAAINHEIKRIVTDVLLQVTAELFDEIATKVISEDDPTVEDSRVTASTATVPDTKAVSLPLKIKDTVSSDVSVKVDSSPGDLLGLASYASDDDDNDDDSKNSDIPSFEEKDSQQSIANNLSTGKDVVYNGSVKEKERSFPVNMESDLSSSGKDAPKLNYNATVAELKDEGAANTSNAEPQVAEQRLSHHTSKISNTPGSKDAEKIENHVSRKYGNDFRDELDKNERHEYGSNSSGKNHNVKEMEVPVHKRKEETLNRHDERHNKKERRDDRHSSKEGRGDRVLKSASRPGDSDTRKRQSPDYIGEDRRERQTDSRADAKEENDGKRARSKDDKREKHRDRDFNNSSRHDKYHTYRDREHRDGSRAGDSSNESSDESKKKLHSRRRKSPSPIRSRKRHVSRSPHSKHSQRKHSPYSSLENSRGVKLRSRSRSPVLRKR